MCDQTTTTTLTVQDIAVGDKIRAESTDPTYSVEGTVAEVGGCFIVLDGIGDELDEALHTFSRPPAADQTPATDSEGVERLHEARDLVQEARVSGFTQIDSDTVFAIDDEVTRLTALLAEQAATIERVREAVDRFHEAHADECLELEDVFYGRAEVVHEVRTALGSQRTEGQG